MNGADELILVTGGTGSVGMPLLDSYARDGVAAVALGRTPSRRNPPGIRVLCGDVTRSDLGLEAAVLADLRSRVTSIVHAAALTRFDADLDEALAVNVGGTRHVLAFAARCPKVRRVSVLSTVYVAGKRTGTIHERELDHDCGFVNAYERSKYGAERLAREAMSGLPVTVLRLSTIIGAHENGRVERAAAIHHAMRFLYHSLLPMMPGASDSRVDLLATEYAVDAVRHLSGDGFVAGSTRHVCAADEALGQAELIDLVVQSFMHYRPAWRRRAIEKPSIVELRTFELFRESVEAVADQGLRASLAVLAPFAPQLAHPKMFDDRECRRAIEGTGIRRPSLRETIPAVVRYLIDHNWAQTPDAQRGSASAGQGAEANA